MTKTIDTDTDTNQSAFAFFSCRSNCARQSEYSHSMMTRWRRLCDTETVHRRPQQSRIGKPVHACWTREQSVTHGKMLCSYRALLGDEVAWSIGWPGIRHRVRLDRPSIFYLTFVMLVSYSLLLTDTRWPTRWRVNPTVFFPFLFLIRLTFRVAPPRRLDAPNVR